MKKEVNRKSASYWRGGTAETPGHVLDQLPVLMDRMGMDKDTLSKESGLGRIAINYCLEGQPVTTEAVYDIALTLGLLPAEVCPGIEIPSKDTPASSKVPGEPTRFKFDGGITGPRFGKAWNLERIMQDRGVTDYDVADYLGIHFTVVNAYRKCRRGLLLERAEDIASFLAVSVDELKGEEEAYPAEDPRYMDASEEEVEEEPMPDTLTEGVIPDGAIPEGGIIDYNYPADYDPDEAYPDEAPSEDDVRSVGAVLKEIETLKEQVAAIPSLDYDAISSIQDNSRAAKDISQSLVGPLGAIKGDLRKMREDIVEEIDRLRQEIEGVSRNLTVVNNRMDRIDDMVTVLEGISSRLPETEAKKSFIWGRSS